MQENFGDELAEEMAFFPDTKVRMSYDDKVCEVNMSMEAEDGTMVMNMDFEGDCREDFFQETMGSMDTDF